MSNSKYDDLPLTIKEENGKKRFELTIGDQIAFMDYMLVRGNVIYLTHTEVPNALEGQGVGSTIVKKVLAYIRENDFKMAPLCPFVAAYLKRHPREADGILADGFRIG